MFRNSEHFSFMKGNEMKETKQNKACQYLYAVIKEADWIDEEYKKFAEKYKKTEAPLIELYLCICDKVSLDVLQLVELNEPVEEAFRECRRKHLESGFMKKYSNDIRQIKHIATATEKEVKNMSGTVKHIADNIPTFEEMFMQPAANKDQDEPQKQKKSSRKEMQKEKEQIEVQSEKLEQLNEPVENEQCLIASKKTPRTSFEKFLDKPNSIFSRYRKKRPGKYIEALVKEGYSVEQIDFILDCMEAGDSIREIEEFASPKITVELMKKLRNMKKEN